MKWTTDRHERIGRPMLIIYKLDQEVKEGHDMSMYVRGQIMCDDIEEVEQWEKLVETLNLKQE